MFASARCSAGNFGLANLFISVWVWNVKLESTFRNSHAVFMSAAGLDLRSSAVMMRI